MSRTYQAIASITAPTSVSGIEFSSIPSTYTDLVLVTNLRSVSGSNNVRLILNNDTGTNYSRIAMIGNGSSTSGSNWSNTTNMVIDDITSATFGFGAVTVSHFMSYSNTSVFKTVLTSAANYLIGVSRVASTWRSTAAISTINVSLSGSNIATGSIASLYGIRAG